MQGSCCVDWTTRICSFFEAEAVYYTHHAKAEMQAEEFGEVRDHEVHEAVCAGEVLQRYPADLPYPSALILGITEAGRPLHVVCAHDAPDQRVIIVTVYEPDPAKWIDWRTRRTP